jgi:hypothetical protein
LYAVHWPLSRQKSCKPQGSKQNTAPGSQIDAALASAAELAREGTVELPLELKLEIQDKESGAKPGLYEASAQCRGLSYALHRQSPTTLSSRVVYTPPNGCILPA